MTVTGHTVMSDAAVRVSTTGASLVVAGSTAAARAVLGPPTYVLVYGLSDLPAASGGVITLAANTTYVVTTTVDLAGARLVCGANTTLLGGSNESCRIKSTGLGATALITSAYSLPMRNLAIEATVALALDATGNAGQALDWTAVTFVDTATIGVIRAYSTAIFFSCAFINAAGMTLDGAIDTVAIDTCSLAIPAGQTGITVAVTATISRSLRVQYTDVTVGAAGTGIAVPDLAAFPVAESFILNTVVFSGAGAALSGISQASNQSRIAHCTGIENSATVASYYMTANVEPTNTTVQGTFYKVAGTTVPGAYVRKFTLANNRATFTGSLSGFFRVTAIASVTDGNNQNIALRIAVDGTPDAASDSFANTGSGGRAQSIAVQGIVSLVPGSYVELWAANTSSSGGALVVSEMNLIINRVD
jgi:hypothetical protein